MKYEKKNKIGIWVFGLPYTTAAIHFGGGVVVDVAGFDVSILMVN